LDTAIAISRKTATDHGQRVKTDRRSLFIAHSLLNLWLAEQDRFTDC
jgi:hypothetical protein